MLVLLLNETPHLGQKQWFSLCVVSLKSTCSSLQSLYLSCTAGLVTWRNIPASISGDEE